MKIINCDLQGNGEVKSEVGNKNIENFGIFGPKTNHDQCHPLSSALIVQFALLNVC